METLIEAYEGYHEVDREEAIKLILADTCFKRLEVYCNWNGLIGYSNDLFQIATKPEIIKPEQRQ